MLIIDKLAYASKIREKSPGLKVALSMSTLIVCISTNSILMSILILIIMGYLTVKYSQVSFCRYLKFLSLPFTFLMLSTVAILFNISSEPGDLWNMSLGSLFLSISKADLIHTIKLVFVALSSVACLYFMSLTTPMVDIIYVMKKVKIPKLFIELTLLIYRFMFILLDMADSIGISQKARLGNISFKARMKSISMLLSVILIRALGKANNLYNAMESRCYDGNIRVIWEHKNSTKKEKIFLLIYIMLITSIGILIRLKEIV